MNQHENLCRQLCALLNDAKAQDIVTIPLGARSSLADTMIIASGSSTRHIASMADKVSQFFKKQHQLIVATEGLPQGDWVLIDGGDTIIHLFRPEVRDFYKLDKLWSAPLQEVE